MLSELLQEIVWEGATYWVPRFAMGRETQVISSFLVRHISPQVLAESDQMRKEADDIGPKAELDHWKKRMAKFNSLLDQIKGQECKAALGIMIAAKSKLIKVCSI